MDPEDLQNIRIFLRHMKVNFYDSKLAAYEDNFSKTYPEKFAMSYSELRLLLEGQSVDQLIISSPLKLKS
jgi:hypothetical protein